MELGGGTLARLAVTGGTLPDPAFWSGRRVLLTGHTGFKGAWAALWLARLGAEVTGLALPPVREPALFDLARVAERTTSRFVDLRDRSAVASEVARADPEIVLHLAAQAIVRTSLQDPVGTFAANVMGTVHLLDASRQAPALQAVLVVTSDKVYANAGAGRAFAEADPLGGKDPYSASKAAAEMATASFAQAYFAARGVPVATARGGNVIGGGDFAEDRLVPDIVRAARNATPLVLRHPGATRPWQHVLDCVGGYLCYAEALASRRDIPTALNFGPDPADRVTVAALAEAALAALGRPAVWECPPAADSLEAMTLAVDPGRAQTLLGLRNRLDTAAAVRWTMDWYAQQAGGADARALTESQIATFAALAR